MRTYLDESAADVRHAVRALRRSPWFTTVSLATLVIGIASVAAIFSWVYSFYWRPLPFREADRILAFSESRSDRSCCYNRVSVPVGFRIATSSRSYERIAFWDQSLADAVVGGEARQLSILLADTSLAQLLDVRPQLGRVPSAEETRANAPVVAISDALWRAMYGSDRDVIGKRLRLGGDELRIIGVLPAGFAFPWRTDALRPLPPIASSDVTSPPQSIGMLGRLRRNVARATAGAELRAIQGTLTQESWLNHARVTLSFQPEMLDRRANQGLPLPSLFIGAAVLLLLIACSNVANLMLVRVAERRSEIAVRAALGASRARLIRFALAESVVVAVTAGVLGTLGSVLLVRVALLVLPTQGLPTWLHFGLDERILAFTIGLVGLVAVVVGLTPAREGTRFDLVRALKIGGDGGIVNTAVTRNARRGMAIQLSLSIALFVGAGLLVRSYQRISKVNLGYAADRLAEMSLFYDETRYPTSDSRLAFASEFAARVRRLPGASAVTVRGTATLTMVGAETATPMDKRKFDNARDDRVIPDGDTTRAAHAYRMPMTMRGMAVADNYFATLGLRTTRGRTFAPQDVSGGDPVVVVSERLAAILWPHMNPVGRSMQRGLHATPFTVIGVVQDVRDMRGGRAGYAADARPDAYYSVRQVEAWYPAVIWRAGTDPSALSASARRELAAADPQLVSRIGSLGGDEEARLVTRVFGGVIATFAIAGLVLSVMGLYGVIAYGIEQRRREIGIRLVLGAAPAGIVSMIVTQSMRFVAIGLGAGLLIAAGLSQVMRALLFQVSPADPLTYAAACALFGTVAFVACYLPALRATGVDPVSALKSD